MAVVRVQLVIGSVSSAVLPVLVFLTFSLVRSGVSVVRRVVALDLDRLVQEVRQCVSGMSVVRWPVNLAVGTSSVRGPVSSIFLRTSVGSGVVRSKEVLSVR